MNFLKEMNPFLDMKDYLDNLLERKDLSKSLKFKNLGIDQINLEVSEDDKHYYIEAAMPGANKEDINLNIENNHLILSYERKYKNEKEGRKFRKSEISYGIFQQIIRLDENISKDKIEAKYNNGILEITIPKLQSSTLNNQKITIK